MLTTASTTDAEDEERVVAESIGPIRARDARSAAAPPPIQSSGTRMLSNISANASVASAR